jgi:hypothetical protein
LREALKNFLYKQGFFVKMMISVHNAATQLKTCPQRRRGLLVEAQNKAVEKSLACA